MNDNPVTVSYNGNDISSVEWMTRCTRGIGISNYNLPWRNIHFTETGLTRLAVTIGYITGLEINEATRSLAERLADNLVKNLNYLNSNGGDGEVEVDSASQPLNPVMAPRYKIVIGDDHWSFGGFTLSWYKMIPPTTYNKAYQQVYESIPADKRDDTSYSAIERGADELLRVNKDLEVTRGYRVNLSYKPHNCTSDDPKDWYRYENVTVRYTFTFNGGLLCHGMGQDPLAVRLTNDGPGWSVHT